MAPPSVIVAFYMRHLSFVDVLNTPDLLCCLYVAPSGERVQVNDRFSYFLPHARRINQKGYHSHCEPVFVHVCVINQLIHEQSNLILWLDSDTAIGGRPTR